MAKQTGAGDPADAGKAERESLRAKVAAAIAKDPRRAADQVKRWMRKD